MHGELISVFTSCILAFFLCSGQLGDRSPNGPISLQQAHVHSRKPEFTSPVKPDTTSLFLRFFKNATDKSNQQNINIRKLVLTFSLKLILVLTKIEAQDISDVDLKYLSDRNMNLTEVNECYMS